ncbi:hypothetical protein [Leeia aquatica]|uniref:Uncharacterized protein n=1 Tax=Leeia aquatica TaxID=2725557 RepID=A0A847SGF6_9NEIS|nr:hypothetical protein [Leeia aquatica]NLR75022.1 hypothetical protein [Leeia aquatica]
MPDNEITLVLSGHVCRSQSTDMRPFWSGYIELQRKLPADCKIKHIATHSWNPELADLVNFVYAPAAVLHERQPVMYAEFMHKIVPPDRFEKGLDRLNSTWKNVSIQSVLGNARSRAKAVQLLNALSGATGQVLITRWDLGQTGSSQVNRLVFDSALPHDYIYMSHFSEVDEGYADMWITAPWRDALLFAEFDRFVLDSLSGANPYLEQFCEKGWPLARIKTQYENAITHPIGQRVHSKLLKILRAIQVRTKANSLPNRLVRRAVRPLQRFMERPMLSAEVSCTPDLMNKRRVFPPYMALNIHALLKFFILGKNLREKTRFLSHDDFIIDEHLGCFINPQPLVLLVLEGESAERLSVLERSPLPIAKVVFLGPYQQGKPEEADVSARPYAPRDRILDALEEIKECLGETSPVLVLPSVECYMACTDWFYLGALIKYIAWRNPDYISLNGKGSGKVYADFPDLCMARGGGVFNLKAVAGTAKGIHSILTHADVALVDVCAWADKMALDFLAVSNGRMLFPEGGLA